MPDPALSGKEASREFHRRVALALANERIQLAVDRGTRRQDAGRREIIQELPDPLAACELAARVKDHTLQNLDRYLEQLIGSIRRVGGQVHFAETGEQACAIIADIARTAGVHRIVKTKSMATEEVELNPALERAGLEVVETDLGEYILQIAHERPFHLVAPVLHKNRQDIGRLFADKLGIAYTEDPEVLTATARRVLREKFRRAEMGVIGANFAVAETGTVCIVTNEGNGRFCTSRPRMLVALMGMEKVIPRMRDLGLFLKLLAKSGTGQRTTCYTSLITGPRRPGDADGPDEFHVVVLDRGRSGILAGEYRTTLRCIRCGACLNACPVYRKIGGYAYNSVYMGPIGKLLTPLMSTLEAHEQLPQASSLCGACLEACPVRIDIPALLIRMRHDLQRRGRLPRLWGLGFRLWRMGMQSARLYHLGARLNGWLMRRFARDGWLHWLPGQMGGWTKHRDFPALAERPFREQWKELQRELETEEREADRRRGRGEAADVAAAPRGGGSEEDRRP